MTNSSIYLEMGWVVAHQAFEKFTPSIKWDMSSRDTGNPTHRISFSSSHSFVRFQVIPRSNRTLTNKLQNLNNVQSWHNGIENTKILNKARQHSNFPLALGVLIAVECYREFPSCPDLKSENLSINFTSFFHSNGPSNSAVIVTLFNW